MASTAERQFASKLSGFSSQYGSANSVSYVVGNIIGKPSLYPQYGDSTEACVLRTYAHWWKIAPEAQQPLPNPSDRYFTADDFIELEFDHKVYIREVRVYEVYNPGAIVRILALDQAANELSRMWHVLWEVKGGHPPATERQSRIFSPPITLPPFPSQVIRLEFRNDNLDYYTELDAVELHGVTDIDVDCIADRRNEQILSSRFGDIVLEDTLQTDCTSEAKGSGLFDTLPDEMIQIILSYLSLDQLCQLAQVSTLFYEHCYNSMLPLHRHLNLQPFWYKVNQGSVDGFSRKCTNLQSLNMSWCGCHSDILNSLSFTNLVASTTLVRLDVACCPLTDETFRCILSCCPNLRELDVSSTSVYLSSESLRMIATLASLTRLNLYLTAVDDVCIINISVTCPNLEYLNLGSCQYIEHFDNVLAAISKNCPSIKGLDLWRAKSLTNDGIMELATTQRHLTSLDIGWCFRVDGSEGSIEKLIEGCGGLKKLNLTANRSISDTELFALAKHCPDLEQLDLLGNRLVSPEGLHTLLKHCKCMVFLDVSFCAQVTPEHHEDLSTHYPKCAIKKSFLPN